MCSRLADEEFDQLLQALADATEHVDDLGEDVIMKLREACEEFLGRAIDRGEEPPYSAEEALEEVLE